VRLVMHYKVGGTAVRGGWCCHCLILLFIIIITTIKSTPSMSLSSSLWFVVGAVPALSPGMTALMKTSRERDCDKKPDKFAR
jgi:hypothetical protein